MLRVTKQGKSRLQWDKVVDSANKTSFDGGSVRDSQEGKGRYDLIPTGPIHRLAQHYENGAIKYAPRNWEKGQPLSQYYNSAIRHLMALRDADLSEDHAAAALWNIVAIMHHIDAMIDGKLPVELDDFGILDKIKEQETYAQIKEQFTHPHTVRVMMSGAYEGGLPLPDYLQPTNVQAFDKDRFKQEEPKRYGTRKLNPEEY